MIDLARADSFQTRQYPVAVRCPVGRFPVDPACRCRSGDRCPSGRQRAGQPVRYRRTGQALIPPLAVAVAAQHAIGPAAGGLGDPVGSPVGAGVRVGQVADPAAAHRPGGIGPPVPGGPENTSSPLTGCIDTLGAITASAPNHSPVSAAGGGKSSRLVARPTARSTAGAPPRSPSRSIRTVLA